MSDTTPSRIAASPCVGICQMDAATDLCIGCGRTLAEIAAWAGMSDDRRRAVRERLPERMEILLRAGALGPQDPRA